jgi:outer membrane protein OmpA-like peptidoglycan-associated protein
VLDPNDQCIDEPQGPVPDPARPGCPVPDRDHDTVLDPQDQCVDEPQGLNPDPTRPGCPRGDRDADNVFNDEDQCPDEHQGPRPSPTRRGCPALDADQDGILDPPDGPDQCPTQAETYNGINDDDGCPDAEALVVRSGTDIRIMEQVNFRTNRDEIVGPRSFAVLDAVVSLLRAMPNITSVDVQGHTDDRGAADHNRDLSFRRAASVRRYLMAHGVEEARLEAHGFGPDCPLVTGRTANARRANRRVQFLITGPDTPAGRCHNPTAR